MFSFQLSLTFFKKKDKLPNSKPNLSIMSNMMLRKARDTVGSLWKLPVPLPVPIRRNATDVVIHSPRNTWNTARQRMLRAEPATKLDITKSVVRSQGTFQRRVIRRHKFWSVPYSGFQAGFDYIFDQTESGVNTSNPFISWVFVSYIHA